MKTIALILGLKLCEAVLCPSALGAATPIDFDDAPNGEVPRSWTVAITGEGNPVWRVAADASAPSRTNVLQQSSETPKPSFPLCLKDQSALRDGFVEVKFKTVSGKTDQAAGVVWRAKDKGNYYVCRANALEDNVVLYKLENGQRKALDIVGRQGGYGAQAKVSPAQWHTLRVEFTGSRFKVLLNGKDLFEVEDTTFAASGMVGLWTKADSVTQFDDFIYGDR